MFVGQPIPPVWDLYMSHQTCIPGFTICLSIITVFQAVLVQALHSGWPKDAAQEAGPSRYGPRAARWVPVKEHAALHEVLRSPDYVIPGVPVFFVVAAGTAFRERFLADETPLL